MRKCVQFLCNKFVLITLVVLGIPALAAAVPELQNSSTASKGVQPASTNAAASSPGAVSSGAVPANSRSAFVNEYCVSCHNSRLKTGGLVLEGVQMETLTENPDIWEKVAERLAAGEMPPRFVKKRPDPAKAHEFVASVIAELDASNHARPYAGRTVLRRLNRTEYGNAIRDLLGVPFSYRSDLPLDGSATGFDNTAESLSISPLLLESYLKVARRVSFLALEGDEDPVTDRYIADKNQALWQGQGMPLGTRGGILVKKYFPRDGEYELRAFLNNADLTPTEGVRLFRTRVQVKAGLHTFIVTFPQSSTVHEGPLPNFVGLGGQPLGGPADANGITIKPTLIMTLDGAKLKEFPIGGLTAGEAVGTRGGPPTLAHAEITGPFNAAPVANTTARARILVCEPKTQNEELPCAEKIVRRLVRGAYRRPPTAEDIQPLMATFSNERKKSDFTDAIAVSLRNILISPKFLFRVEFQPKTAVQGTNYAVSDLELASRLSFFLWSSIPDDKLIDLATAKKLRQPAVLQSEVRRMLQDPRSDALMDNFASQWLGLREVNDAMPDSHAYRDYDPALRDAFIEETRLFLRSIMKENRSVVDVVSANYSFLNDRLAKVYRVPGVKGDSFRRVTFEGGSPRGGILGQGSILVVTSHTDKTSPVLRGKWILTNLLASPPNAPPAGVPPLNLAPDATGKVLTTREQVERHRANPVCAGCHDRMDPYGFSLENFDVIGQWREKDEGGPINAEAQLSNGQTFVGPQGLRRTLSAQPQRLVEAFTSRLMTYALGRAVTARDMPRIREIVKNARPSYKFEDVVLNVVKSPQFMMAEASVRQ